MAFQLRALVFSPTLTHPPFRGNRQRILQMAGLLRAAGFHLTLAVGANKKVTPDAQRFWDAITPISPSPKWKPSSILSPFDSWYSDGVGESLARAVKATSSEVVLFNYVFHSKALEFLSPGITTVLDTHEVFSSSALKANSRVFRRGFFSCSPDDERRYLDRADKAIAISDADARQFEALGTTTPLVHIPYVVEGAQVNPSVDTGDLPVWGIAMSANDHNLSSLRDFIHHVATLFGSAPPFRVVIAGDIDKLAYRFFPHRAPYFRRKWITYVGQIPNIAELYRRVTGIVVPVVEGTGMAIKFAHPLAYGVPIVSTAVGSRGSHSDHPLHTLSGNGALAATLPEVTRNQLENLSLHSQNLHRRLHKQVKDGWNALGLG